MRADVFYFGFVYHHKQTLIDLKLICICVRVCLHSCRLRKERGEGLLQLEEEREHEGGYGRGRRGWRCFIFKGERGEHVESIQEQVSDSILSAISFLHRVLAITTTIHYHQSLVGGWCCLLPLWVSCCGLFVHVDLRTKSNERKSCNLFLFIYL